MARKEKKVRKSLVAEWLHFKLFWDTMVYRVYLVAEWLHFKLFWDTMVPYSTESVHFFWAYELRS